ncbi:MAG: histidine kinase [Betaproteobacteria bacterium]|jgi:two-component system sensor histidine kinase PilS (NtrC family)|nr:histidine kinase [Betaproteobacteria bacterium]
MRLLSSQRPLWQPALEGLSAGPPVSDSFWVSLRYFNAYRIVVAGLFFVSVLFYQDLLLLGLEDVRLYAVTSAIYLAIAIGFHVLLRRAPYNFNAQLTAHIIVDVVAITLLSHASGGFRSGLAVMLLVSVAAAGLVSRGTQLLAYAALASIAVLAEQTVQILSDEATLSGYLQPALLSIGYFASAMITSLLAQRVITNERVARQRGIELANQLRISELVIQDVQDGVLVVDANGLVRQHNRRVEALLGRSVPELEQIEGYSRELAEALAAWRAGTGPSQPTLTLDESGRNVRARFVEAGLEGAKLTVIYLEDMSKLEEQARQLKLAALGRLTANIAHEIRNPLASVTHATELLQEENRAPARERLIRIIHDNALRLNRMVHDVLELNRRDRVQADSVRLAAFVSAFVDEFAPAEGLPSGAVNLDLQGDPVIECDRVHLNQILWNLVRNAWRHSTRQPGSVRIVVQRTGGRIELHVVDDGPGVPRDLRPQLFEPFFTTFSAGTGLGLYIARELAAANGATLEYIDRGAGADFRLAWQGDRT